MINRVTDTIKYNMITNNLFFISGKYGELMEKLSTQKAINRPSDDPIGTNDILDFRTARTTLAQYQTNIADASIWLNMTDTNLSGLYNVVEDAKIIAITESGAGGSAETRQTLASTVDALIEEAITLLNAKNGDNYIFGGSRTDVPPFSATYVPAEIGPASSSTGNQFNGTVAASGSYSGLENKSYVLRVIEGGVPAAAQYQISSDGGRTWGAVQTDLSAPVNLGDGITLTFTAGTADFAANDQFMVRATIGGYYSGNSDALKTVIGTGNVFTFNINGAELATSANGPAATVAVAGAGSGLTVEDPITLSRGGSASSWTLTGRENYPDMVITSQSSTTMTIDADNDGADDLTISLSGNWNSGNTLSFEVSPGSPPSVANVDAGGPGSVDLLTTLFALRDALASNDETAIAAQVEDLKVAQTQILQAQTKSGAKLNALEMASKNHDAVNLQITNMLADIENADLTKLITEFQMKQIAMQASYSMASQIGKLTILDYI